MKPMNVHLGDAFDRFVAALIRSGQYHTQSEVIRDGLRLLKEREDLKAARLDQLKRQIAIGLDQLERGQVAKLDVAAIKAKGRRALAKQRASRKSD